MKIHPLGVRLYQNLMRETRATTRTMTKEMDRVTINHAMGSGITTPTAPSSPSVNFSEQVARLTNHLRQVENRVIEGVVDPKKSTTEIVHDMNQLALITRQTMLVTNKWVQALELFSMQL